MLKVENITFTYNVKSTDAPVLNTIDFTVNKGEHISIIGESGSGKSTLLKLIYGEYDLNEGQIFWKDKEILGPKYNLVVGYDFMKYVAQEFDLMPFITVEENIGKHLSNFFPEEKKERVQELLTVVELQDFVKTKVKTLSGGQKQRVALARALAKQPEIILLDEPFSHIDNFQKQSLRRSVFAYLKEKNITCLVATHDREDVLGYADRMLVLHDSKIIANNSPQELYRHPELPLIASFFGEVNVLDNVIVFAHQLKSTDSSDLKAIVLRSYFKGHYYLIEADYQGAIIRFEHPTALEKNREVFLEEIKRQ
ncbi:ABC-type Fe3+/spermidine/putrescine transport system ATPase subunit [Gelidibacter algens]|uniref:ABC-type Fe3+/spermidine/putrescine transport system ATPase subunit n=1 Tax=Gelidibacter algens TaxID=49280 RepID=A0A1A7R5A5_9FLAO|nr:ABC transporter ATP-binding protein [Gelidibacter algens]OBX26683.1 ABC transporter ATP-binding protein [Gelidibacter algens]RAJ25746.1 ABC-type Fe3+/spermidine/putrescine transport system ATPase subunit [Gelidibacter algens]